MARMAGTKPTVWQFAVVVFVLANKKVIDPFPILLQSQPTAAVAAASKT